MLQFAITFNFSRNFKTIEWHTIDLNIEKTSNNQKISILERLPLNAAVDEITFANSETARMKSGFE